MKKDECSVENLIDVLNEYRLTELNYEVENGMKIQIKKSQDNYSAIKQDVYKENENQKRFNERKDNKIKSILSPGIGHYFYDNIIKVGDIIKVGQNIGDIRVMGLKTPLKATVSGIIEEIVVENGGVVDYSKELLKIKVVTR